MKNLVVSILAVLTLVSHPIRAMAASPSEAEVLGSSLLAQNIALWLKTKVDPKPSSVAILSIQISPPLEPEFAGIFEGELIKSIKAEQAMTVMTCIECRSAKVKFDGDRLLITKGANNVEALRDLARRLNTQSFLALTVFRTGISLITQATLYQASDGEILGVETFKVPALDIGSSAMQFELSAGPSILLGGSAKSDPTSIPFGINLIALEELGFGKGGLNAGALLTKSNGVLGYLLPTVGLRGRLGATPVTSLSSLGLGFGFTGAQAGFEGRIAYDIFIGSFTVLGVDANYFLPVKRFTDTKNQVGGFLGLHIGVALGR